MNSVNTQNLLDAKILWDYHHLHQPLRHAEMMLVLGSHDIRVAEYATKLFKQNLAPIIIVSGGIAHVGDLLETGWKRSEAEEFSDVMIRSGVPQEKILMETKAKNTGENFTLSAEILKKQAIEFTTSIVVTKPYMERRAYATGKIQWPKIDLIITSSPLNFKEYVSSEIDQEVLVNIMVGDLQRILEYPSKGFQIVQDIPPDILDAYQRLVMAGYDKHLFK